MKKSSILVGLTVALTIVSGIGAYVYFSNSPEYSVKQAVDSLREKDKAKFENYVDIDNVLNKMVDDVLNATLQQKASESKGGFEAMGIAFGMKMIESFKPQITSMIKSEIFGAFEIGTRDVRKNTNAKEHKKAKDIKGVRSLLEIFDSRSFVFKEIGNSKISGDTAILPVNFHHKKFDKDFSIEIKLLKNDGPWKISEIRKVGQLVVDLERWKKDYLVGLNHPIREQIKKTLTLSKVDKRDQKGRWGMNNFSVITIDIKNSSEQSIKSYNGVVHLKNSSGGTLKKISLKNTDPLDAQQVFNGQIKVDINPFIQNELTLFKTKKTDLITTLEINRIEFTDGSNLEILDQIPSDREIAKK